jgi:formylglycine-generating enzyme
MKRIFISYRYSDSQSAAALIGERLRLEFGVDEVFVDFADLPLNKDFARELQRHLVSCSVVLALIGPGWLDATDAHGQRRLDDVNDFVRIELELALRMGIPVIPILIDGARFPLVGELPEALRPLYGWRSMQFSMDRLEASMDNLVRIVRNVLEDKKPDEAEMESEDSPFTNVNVSTLRPPSLVSSSSVLAPSVELSPAANGELRKTPPEQLANFPPPWASAWGDDAHGLWADLHVGDDAAPVVQRLRWIGPGTFFMGSPESEPERYNNEGPQHAVRISAGFWLADSACTQALWLAVLGGKNPAHFNKDPLCPVEQVDFEAVERFLTQLNQQLPVGEHAVLPTEAMWEYACRAGTTKPFSFGDTITPAQVNYDSNYPYGKARKGKFLERTVPVKSLPPNDWGLFEMHGNVWEWCADGTRQYEAVPAGQVVLDPEGPTELGPEAPRAFRGGSWSTSAGYCRSAFRDAIRRSFAPQSLGFRFALRSTSTSQAQPNAPAGA